MADYITVAKVGSINDGSGEAFNVAGRMVAVFNCGGEYHAINDFCPHQGASLSGSPVAEDGSVMCPWHGYRFDIRSGACLSPESATCKLSPAPQLAIENGKVIARSGS